MVERPQRSEDERPLHMWAPPRPYSGGEAGYLPAARQRLCDLTGQAWPGGRLRRSRRRTHIGWPVARLGGENLSHRHRELSVSPATRPGRRSSRTADTRNPVPCPAERGIQLFRSLARRRRLSGMRLRHPQLSHGVHQREQVPGQRTGLTDAIAPGHCEQPRRGAQPLPLAGAARYLPVRCPGRPVIPIGGAAQHPAAGHPRRGVQRVRRRPRRVRPGTRITRGAPAQVLCRDGGLPRRVPVNVGAFRGSDPERPGTLRPLRPLQRPTGLAAGAASASRATAHRHTSAALRPVRRARAGSPRTRSPHPG